MNKNITRYIFAGILMLIFSFHLTAQLSMFNKIDTFKGYNPKLVALDKGFLTFNSPQWASDTVKFRLSRFNECGDLDWTNDYYTYGNAGNSRPDVIKNNNEMYLLLKSNDLTITDNYLTLVKLNINGDITWSKTFTTADNDIYTYYSNILINRAKDVIYLITSDKNNNTLIISLDTDGEILDSKKIVGIHHNSSIIDTDGNLVIFSDSTAYAKIALDEEIIDTLIWAKEIQGRYFSNVNDPVVVDDNNFSNIITAVIDTSIRKDTVNTDPSVKLDTAMYRLVKFDTDGNIVGETDGFLATDYKEHPAFLKVLEGPKVGEFPVFFMVHDKVFFFTSNLNKFLDPKIYKFAKDSFELNSSSLEICMDVSLVMSGFCYKTLDSGEIDMESPYLFVSKTQPSDKGFVIESEEPVCLEDSTSREFITMNPTTVNDILFSMDTVEMKVEDIELKRNIIMGFNEEKCGKVNMTQKNDTITLCPGTYYSFNVPGLKGATYEWSTGEKNVTSIVVSKKGTYSATVTLCDTVRVSTFVYQYTQNTDDCFTVYYPNAFFPTGRTDSLNAIFKVFQKEQFSFDVFEMKIFDRWGEKVFESTDPNEGWDGTFRGKDMPPGVYLYNVHWEAILEDQTYKGDKKGQVMLLR